MFKKAERTEKSDGIQDLSAEECKAVLGGDRVIFNYRHFHNTPTDLTDESLVERDAQNYTRT